ncbi:MAG: Sec-independent protein translocase protein TatB [Bacteroidales bacterium]|jgi:Tat protein translocase TatB subunit|nr:Sec-independent protein translocase protein TatB [Bacteroidales bacterium]HOI32193.1 Sec-independent protein translocase protein TatB [Bacteroidales bacterium]
MNLLFFNIGTGELLLILLVLFVVLGPKKLPEVARTVGKTINEMKRASAGFKNEINKEIERIEHDTNIKDVNINFDKTAQPEVKPPALEDSIAQGSIHKPDETEIKNQSIKPAN